MIKKPAEIIPLIIVFTWLVGVGCITQGKIEAIGRTTALQPFTEGFDEGKLNLGSWQITHQGDFNEWVVDVYDIDRGQATDYRLRLQANTIGTKDDTVKYLGLRSVQQIDFSTKKKISFELDWNNQRNGCYLSAGIYICPISTNTNPKNEKAWLKFEYVGVPPGRNARSVIATKTNGLLKQLYMDGWPSNREGRAISLQNITIVLDGQSLQVIENNKELYRTSSHKLGFTSGYLYLQMSSQSNYPAREVFFDNISISSLTRIIHQ